MTKWIQTVSPEWSLRAGLGVMYLYSGMDILQHPTAWYWAVRPVLRWFPGAVQISLAKPAFTNKFLLSQGIIELIFAVVLLSWFLPKKWPKCVAGLTALEMAAILVLIPIDAVTFRDIGLLGGALALYLLLLDRKAVPLEAKKPKAEPSKSNSSGEPAVQTYEEFMKR